MARIDQLFDAVRGMRASMDRLQHVQAQKVAGVGTPVQQVLSNFAQNLKRADDAYKKASDSAAKAMQAQQTAQARVQSVYNSVVNKIPVANRNRATINQALGNAPAYQAAQSRVRAAQSRTATARGRVGQSRQRATAAARANLQANARANSAIGAVTAGLGKVAGLAAGPVGAALTIMIGAAGAVAQSFERMKSQLNSVHQSMTGFNVAIGQAQFMLKVGDVQRRFNMAQRVERGAVQFAESENRARNAFQSADVFSHNAGSLIATAGNNIIAQIGEAFSPIFDAANTFMEFMRDSSVSTFVSSWLDAVGPVKLFAEGGSVFMKNIYKVVVDLFNFVTANKFGMPDDFDALMIAINFAKGAGAPPPRGNEAGALGVGKRPRKLGP